MTTDFDESSNIIDSRDVIERIWELRALRVEYAGTGGWTDEDRAELEDLEALASEGESAADWIHGETLIRDSYFEEYARDLADDIGAVDKDAGWPNSCIDWEKAADELRMDYFSVEFRGVTYWIR